MLTWVVSRQEWWVEGQWEDFATMHVAPATEDLPPKAPVVRPAKPIAGGPFESAAAVWLERLAEWFGLVDFQTCTRKQNPGSPSGTGASSFLESPACGPPRDLRNHGQFCFAHAVRSPS